MVAVNFNDQSKMVLDQLTDKMFYYEQSVEKNRFYRSDHPTFLKKKVTILL